MKKLQKIKLDELAGIDLNEKGLCRILGGEIGPQCQCSCAYNSTPEAMNTSSNSAANTAVGINADCTPKQNQCPPCPPIHAVCSSSCTPPPPVQGVPCGPDGIY